LGIGQLHLAVVALRFRKAINEAAPRCHEYVTVSLTPSAWSRYLSLCGRNRMMLR
jgi:hypothetical protein